MLYKTERYCDSDDRIFVRFDGCSITCTKITYSEWSNEHWYSTAFVFGIGILSLISGLTKGLNSFVSDCVVFLFVSLALKRHMLYLLFDQVCRYSENISVIFGQENNFRTVKIRLNSMNSIQIRRILFLVL